MFIIVRFNVSDRQQRAIATVLGLRGAADREQVREFLQRQGEQTLEAVTLPLVATASTPTPARRQRRDATVGV